jgi:hypothetical protein
MSGGRAEAVFACGIEELRGSWATPSRPSGARCVRRLVNRNAKAGGDVQAPEPFAPAGERPGLGACLQAAAGVAKPPELFAPKHAAIQARPGRKVKPASGQ